MSRTKKSVSAHDAPKLRVLSSTVAYKGPVFTVSTDTIEEPNGIRATRDLIRHGGSIVILPVDDSAKGKTAKGKKNEPRVLLIRQYRYAAEQMLWEVPAGHIEKGEDRLESAKRELKEETGYTAKRLKQILKFYVSPGVLNEVMFLYLATGLTAGKAEPEEDEKISSRFFPLSQAVRMCLTGKIIDSKTICAIFWLFAHTKGNFQRG